MFRGGPGLRAAAAIRSFPRVSSPFSIPGAKATLLLAITMTLIGFVGISGSLSGLTTSPSELATTDPSAPPEVAAAASAFLQAFLGSPIRKAMSVANLLVSSLLLVASFLMTGRARSALWWTGQALWANVAYSLAAAAGNVYLIHAHRAELLSLVSAMVDAQAAAGDPLPADGAAGVPILFMALSAVAGALLAAIYLGMLRVARRETVQKFVHREA